MGGDTKRIVGMFVRYLFVILLGLGNLYVFYKVFTPLTMNVLIFFLSTFNEVGVMGTLISLGSFSIEIVPACVAGAAYYLIFILVFSTPNLDVKRRILLLGSALLTFFILNMGRILFLVVIVGKPYFNVVHWVFWNLLSTVFVIIIWLVFVKVYGVRSIPIYSDVRYVMSLRNS